MIYRTITHWQPKADIARLCRLFHVSRAGFYAARQRTQAAPVLCLTSMHLKSAFHASGGNYGSRRLCAALRTQGLTLGRHRVRRLMKHHGLRPVSTTNSAHALPIASHVLQRQFNPAAADQAWGADITYIRTRRGWLYRAAVLDLFSRKIVGWAMAPTLPAELVCAALHRAIAARRPTPGLIMHSDRGSQYASALHRQLLADHGLLSSMSRKGNCWDNAVMERFFPQRVESNRALRSPRLEAQPLVDVVRKPFADRVTGAGPTVDAHVGKPPLFSRGA